LRFSGAARCRLAIVPGRALEAALELVHGRARSPPAQKLLPFVGDHVGSPEPCWGSGDHPHLEWNYALRILSTRGQFGSRNKAATQDILGKVAIDWKKFTTDTA
jgi:hypothetical protein